ncbi:uncharacterized protein BDR25DRAFT_379374 [Lindgomyces ingoldianus]|uniref:Uncharacterized protein n=1 Tax=Lindgomyces ingoldianus TaxID=673940 RepID=A0ACB6RBV2_9PLEO|nr:uncharacterized protein BDR25DRAFT_379374 [Lindgomyces ingoldianus]KAF2475807.1 hypothetical protein BDR25DRAFT_379374 [Lindgomyces ingoldianus]
MAFGLGASAVVLKRDDGKCCFTLKGTGSVTGPVWQLREGTIRIGGSNPPSKFCIDTSTRTMTDPAGRGCGIGASSKLACRAGISRSHGFLGDGKSLTFRSDPTFWACPVDVIGGEYSVFSSPIVTKSPCVPITLSPSGDCIPQTPPHEKKNMDCKKYDDCYKAPECFMPEVPKACRKPHYDLPRPLPEAVKYDCSWYAACEKAPKCMVPAKVPPKCKPTLSRMAIAPPHANCSWLKECDEMGFCVYPVKLAESCLKPTPSPPAPLSSSPAPPPPSKSIPPPPSPLCHSVCSTPTPKSTPSPSFSLPPHTSPRIKRSSSSEHKTTHRLSPSSTSKISSSIPSHPESTTIPSCKQIERCFKNPKCPKPKEIQEGHECWKLEYFHWGHEGSFLSSSKCGSMKCEEESMEGKHGQTKGPRRDPPGTNMPENMPTTTQMVSLTTSKAPITSMNFKKPHKTTTLSEKPGKLCSATHNHSPHATPAPLTSREKGPAQCKKDLSGSHVQPLYIQQISRHQPKHTWPPSQHAKICKGVSALYTFDIPSSFTGKKCELLFLFPRRKHLADSHFSFNNKGAVDVDRLNKSVGPGATFESLEHANPEMHLTRFDLINGKHWVLDRQPCTPGQISYELLDMDDLCVEFDQSGPVVGKRPVGLYVAAC